MGGRSDWLCWIDALGSGPIVAAAAAAAMSESGTAIPSGLEVKVTTGIGLGTDKWLTRLDQVTVKGGEVTD